MPRVLSWAVYILSSAQEDGVDNNLRVLKAFFLDPETSWYGEPGRPTRRLMLKALDHDAGKASEKLAYRSGSEARTVESAANKSAVAAVEDLRGAPPPPRGFDHSPANYHGGYDPPPAFHDRLPDHGSYDHPSVHDRLPDRGGYHGRFHGDGPHVGGHGSGRYEDSYRAGDHPNMARDIGRETAITAESLSAVQKSKKFLKTAGKKSIGGLLGLVGHSVGLAMFLVIPGMIGMGKGNLAGNAFLSQWDEMFGLGPYKKKLDPVSNVMVWDLANGGMNGDSSLPKDSCGNFIDATWWKDLSDTSKHQYTKNNMVGAKCLSKWIVNDVDGKSSSPFKMNQYMGCSPSIMDDLCDSGDPALCGIFIHSDSSGEFHIDCHGNTIDIGTQMGTKMNSLYTPRSRVIRAEKGYLVPWRRLKQSSSKPIFMGKPNCLGTKSLPRNHCKFGDVLWSDPCVDKSNCENQAIDTEKVMTGECTTFWRKPKKCTTEKQGNKFTLKSVTECYEPLDKETTLDFWGAYVGKGTPTRSIVDLIDGAIPTGLFSPPEVEQVQPSDYTKTIYSQKLIFLPEEWTYIEQDCATNGQAFGHPETGGWPLFTGCKYASRDVHATPDPTISTNKADSSKSKKKTVSGKTDDKETDASSGDGDLWGDLDSDDDSGDSGGDVSTTPNPFDLM